MTDHPVFVIDDDDAVRDALLVMLRSEGLRARGFVSGADFFKRLPSAEAACIVTDVRMPDMDGAEVVRRLVETKGRTWPVIVITGHAEVPMAVQLMKAGVVDFIEKPFEPQRLIEAVRGCIGFLTDQRLQRERAAQTQSRLLTLTQRERQVFDLLVEGKSNKDVALALDISPGTVEIFRAKVMSKMHADSLSSLVRMALTLAS